MSQFGTINPTPFMKISDASKVTGLSTYFLRTGCRQNTIPHIKSGETYFINVPKLLSMLDAESMNQLVQGEEQC